MEKSFQLLKPEVSEAGNLYPPGVYAPGSLPPGLMTSKHGNFVDKVIEVEPEVGVEPVIHNQGVKIDGAIDERDLVDINTATIDDLVKVPNIGNGIATKLIAERANGDFKSVEDLIGRMPQYSKMTTDFERNFKF
jgi:hypothetical protein